MNLKARLAELQQITRDEGWRIEEIPWTAPGQLEVIAPRTPLSKFLLLYGLLAFICGLLLATVLLPWGLTLAASGMLALLLTNLTMARSTYGKFQPVEGRYLDHEIRLFVLRERAQGFGLQESHTWVIRLLCDYERNGQAIRVTPIIPNSVAFTTQAAAENYLKARIHNDRCRLWVDPENSLHTSFHDKPKFQLRGNQS